MGTNDGSSSDTDRSESYVTVSRDGVTTSDFLFTAVLQHERVDNDGGCGLIVGECIAMAIASVCDYVGANTSPARRRAHEIVGIIK